MEKIRMMEETPLHILYINLDRAKGRRANIESEIARTFASLSPSPVVHRIQAVDGASLSDNEVLLTPHTKYPQRCLPEITVSSSDQQPLQSHLSHTDRGMGSSGLPHGPVGVLFFCTTNHRPQSHQMLGMVVGTTTECATLPCARNRPLSSLSGLAAR